MMYRCFPVSEASEKHRAEEFEAITKSGQVVDPSVWHTAQTVGNACGTVGLLHAVLNNAPFVSTTDADGRTDGRDGREGPFHSSLSLIST
jgi:hypothetical protein